MNEHGLNWMCNMLCAYNVSTNLSRKEKLCESVMLAPQVLLVYARSLEFEAFVDDVLILNRRDSMLKWHHWTYQTRINRVYPISMGDLFIVWLSASACFCVWQSLLTQFSQKLHQSAIMYAVPKQICMKDAFADIQTKSPMAVQCVYWSTNIFAHESHLVCEAWCRGMHGVKDREKNSDAVLKTQVSFVCFGNILYHRLFVSRITCRPKSIELKSSKATTVWKTLEGEKPASPDNKAKRTKIVSNTLTKRVFSRYIYCGHICFISFGCCCCWMSHLWHSNLLTHIII